jgi:hypothetical protein
LGLFFRGINGTASVTDYGKRGKIHMGIDLLHEKVRVLGISASPRKDGNSQFMLDVALGSMEKEYGSLVEIASVVSNAQKRKGSGSVASRTISMSYGIPG